MGYINKTILSEKVDHKTGEVLSSSNTVEAYSTKRAEKYAWLFVNSIARIWGVSGSGVVVFTDLIMRMDEHNYVDITSTQKRELILENATKANKGSKKMTPRQAGTRYSQIIADLIARGIVQKIASDRYRVDPNLVSYGFGGMKQIKENRSEYLEYYSSVDLKTGEITKSLGRTRELYKKYDSKGRAI